METVNKVVSSASNMIFGDSNSNKTTESGTEPVSGVGAGSGTEPVSESTGTGHVSEPFDKGNEQPFSGSTGTGHVSEPFDKGNSEPFSGVGAGSGTEPVSESTGTGHVSEPFDKGNEQPFSGSTGTGHVSEPFDKDNSEPFSGVGAGSGTEPVSGSTGAGNLSEPFDKGNDAGETTRQAESGQEPLSGAKGSGTLEEPFDKGNVENSASAPSEFKGERENEFGSSAPSTSINPATKGPESGPSSFDDQTTTKDDSLGTTGGGAPAVNTEGTLHPEAEHDKTGVTSANENQPSTLGGNDIRPSEANEAAPNTNVGGFGTAEPSVGADPKSGQAPPDQQQSTSNPSATPSNPEEEGAVKEKKDEAEQALAKRDPNDHSGEPMKMHDASETKQKVDRSASVSNEGGGEHGKVKGTGEIWEKTSGMASDGGDFDATRPGAGREADRLLEQKGVHREADGSQATDTGATPDSPSDGGEKTSKIDKIKEKLHLGKH